jgi:hypothetical protein
VLKVFTIVFYVNSSFCLYRDFIANANIFQGAVFDEDTSEDNLQSEESEPSKERPEASTSKLSGTSYEGSQLGSTSDKPLSQTNSWERGFKPAAHQACYLSV